jgi:hypothetical protein
MVREPTEYSKRKDAIQEAYRAEMHLRKSRGLPQRLDAQTRWRRMDAQNKWSGARKVMKKVEAPRVSSGEKADSSISNATRSVKNENRRSRVNALAANRGGSMKRTLNAVVEVQYTTGRLEVAE